MGVLKTTAWSDSGALASKIDRRTLTVTLGCGKDERRTSENIQVVHAIDDCTASLWPVA